MSRRRYGTDSFLVPSEPNCELFLIYSYHLQYSSPISLFQDHHGAHFKRALQRHLRPQRLDGGWHQPDQGARHLPVHRLPWSLCLTHTQSKKLLMQLSIRLQQLINSKIPVLIQSPNQAMLSSVSSWMGSSFMSWLRTLGWHTRTVAV